MKKQLLIIGLIAVLFLGGGFLLLSSSDSSEQAKKESEEKTNSANASDAEAVVYFFWGEGCPHCAKEKPFLEDLEEEYPELEVKMLETYNDQENAKLFQEMAAAYNTQARGVPATFIGDSDPILGFSSEETTGKEIENKIQTCIEQGCPDPGSKIK